MWLRYAVNTSGELVYIDQSKRGRTDLHCPYCGGVLTAKKGEIVAAHFEHTGDSCPQADRDIDLGLPAYDDFNLQLSGKVLQALRVFNEQPPVRPLLERYGLITFNAFARVDHWQLTRCGKVPLGKLSLGLFCDFQEQLILERHAKLEQLVADVYDRPALETVIASTKYYSSEQATARIRLVNIAGMDIDTALTDLRIYRAHWRRVLGLTLYILDVADGRYHKIGVTSRPITERLAEIKADVRPLFGDVPIKVLDMFDHRGNAELYFKHRFAASVTQFGTLTEYFHFDDPKAVINELRRMNSKRLINYEYVVLSDEPSDIERQIKRNQIEAKRRALSQKANGFGKEPD